MADDQRTAFTPSDATDDLPQIGALAALLDAAVELAGCCIHCGLPPSIEFERLQRSTYVTTHVTVRPHAQCSCHRGFRLWEKQDNAAKES